MPLSLPVGTSGNAARRSLPVNSRGGHIADSTCPRMFPGLDTLVERAGQQRGLHLAFFVVRHVLIS